MTSPKLHHDQKGKPGFTPGPWHQSHCKNDDGETYSTKVYDHKHVIAVVDWYPIDMGNGRIATSREANARLIAAAPDMYEALKEALPELEESLRECGHDPSVGINASHLIRTIENVEAALAKAEGKEVSND